MKYYSYNLDIKINRPLSLLRIKKLAISEQQILELQDLFLTNGIHHIAVPSLKEGRALVYKFIDALRCYSNIVCFTANGDSLRKSIFDMKSYLDDTDLNHFLIEEFDFDFVWLERDSRNLAGSIKIEEKLSELNFDHHVPIIVLSAKGTHD